ncbi:uncharacterized protein LOC125039066 [Penaeus chinensis]|uniref:uncharacterized protein LOC125039066 n=1 Tax=Penaeus chinensis TaxID=139456 RepID=UPI001FB5CEE7|nr:uncharacterized protein LOC125039066 [Penaeus chinensis]
MDMLAKPSFLILLTLYGWCVGGGSLTAANILTYSGVLPGRPSILRYNTTTPSPPLLMRNEGAYIQVPSKPVTTTGSTGAFTPPARFNNQILPSFANTTETNVTVIRDKTAYLHCHVLNLGTKTETVGTLDVPTTYVEYFVFLLPAAKTQFKRRNIDATNSAAKARHPPSIDVPMLARHYSRLRHEYECGLDAYILTWLPTRFQLG